MVIISKTITIGVNIKAKTPTPSEAYGLFLKVQTLSQLNLGDSLFSKRPIISVATKPTTVENILNLLNAAENTPGIGLAISGGFFGCFYSNG